MRLKYKAGDVVVCTHPYCGHYGDLGIVTSSHWAGSDGEYVMVRLGTGSKRAFFGGELLESIKVIDSMEDLVGLTPTQIHEVLVKEDEEIRHGDGATLTYPKSMLLLHGIREESAMFVESRMY